MSKVWEVASSFFFVIQKEDSLVSSLFKFQILKQTKISNFIVNEFMNHWKLTKQLLPTYWAVIYIPSYVLTKCEHRNIQVNLCQKLFFLQNMGRTCSVQRLFWITVGGIAHICFKQWFQITADAHPGVSKDQKFCEKFKNTHCQVDHPAKIE